MRVAGESVSEGEVCAHAQQLLRTVKIAALHSEINVVIDAPVIIINFLFWHLCHVLKVPCSNGAIEGAGDDTRSCWVHLQSYA